MIRRSPIARRTPPKRKKRVSRKPKRPRLRLKAECDRLFSLYIRKRDGVCRLCGSAARLQCAHLFSRRYFGIRWDPRNAVGLCASHHVFYTHRPLEWDDLLLERFPDWYWVLRRAALREHMPDLEETRAKLKSLLSELES